MMSRNLWFFVSLVSCGYGVEGVDETVQVEAPPAHVSTRFNIEARDSNHPDVVLGASSVVLDCAQGPYFLNVWVKR